MEVRAASVTRSGSDFVSMCMNMRLACGWETLPSELKPEEGFNNPTVDTRPVETRKESLESFLTRLVAARPEYDFAVNDGVVNLFPSAKYVAKMHYKSHLARKVLPFDVHEQYLQIAADDLFAHAGLQHSDIYEGGVSSGLGGSIARKCSVSIKEGTVQQGLNTLVRTDGGSTWIVFPESQGLWDSFLNMAGLGQWPHADKVQMFQYLGDKEILEDIRSRKPKRK